MPQVSIVESLSESVGSLWRGLQNELGEELFHAASPLSSTPVPLYEWVVRNAKSFLNWEGFRFVLMDE